MSESRIYMEGLKPGDVALLQNVAESAAEKAVHKTFIAMGLDPGDPLEAQADQAWVRANRARGKQIAGKVLAAAIGLGFGAAFAAFWAGVKFYATGMSPPAH